MSRTLNRLAVLAMLASVAAFSVNSVDARPGGGKNSGSRGSQTNVAPPPTATAPTAAQPMQRSVNQGAPAAQRPTAAGAPAAAAAQQAARPSMARTMMMGLAGGLLGAGLFGLLSGAGFFSGLASLAGFFGFLLQIALIGGVIYLVMRLIRGRRETAAVGPQMDRMGQPAQPQGDMMQRRMAGLTGAGAAVQVPALQPLQLDGEDFNSFEKLLVDVQGAYGREDVAAIRALSTPEMASYMEGDLADNEAKGLVNRIGAVKLLQGDLSEAWREASGEYATVAMRYSIADAMVDRKTGRTIEGNLDQPGEATEIWTFVREPGQGAAGWKLSAIQQVEQPAMA